MRNILSVIVFFWGTMLPAQDIKIEDYVGSSVCSSCHNNAARAWEGSHHAQAWMPATPETVLGDFDDAEFQIGEMIARFSKEGDAYWVTVTETDGTTHRHQVHSLGGVAPLQQLLIETAPGNIQSFDVVWDVQGEQWYHLYPDQDLPPQEALHWTGPYKNWNARCAECHATGYSRNFDMQSQSYAPQVAEIGVGCESCHGPGQRHVSWAETGGDAPENYGLSAVFDTRDQVLEQCAGCHARRESLQDGNPLPGSSFHDVYNLALLREGLYHADGQILDEVYVAGSFLQSKMYAQGVGCLDCHDAHSGTLKAEGNGLCTQCHSLAGNSEFPTLRLAEYDSPAHHFHSDAANVACKSCHMIERAYMGIDGRRDHSFRVPRPDLGAKIGAPDACTDCHQDQNQDWAAAKIAAWYPDSALRGPHFGEVLFAGRQDANAAVPELSALAVASDAPGIARATALYLLEQATLSEADFAAISAALRDEDPLVRAQAALLQRERPDRIRAGAVVPLLSDQLRNVRSSAARALLGLPPGTIRGPALESLTIAFREWQDTLQARLDFPETHLVLGGLALSMRNFDAAQAAFGEVTRLDPQRADAWVMQVRIAAALGRPRQATALLDSAQSWLPEDATLIRLRRDLRL